MKIIFKTSKKVRLKYTPEELIEKFGSNSPLLPLLNKYNRFYIEIYPQNKNINFCLPMINGYNQIRLRTFQLHYRYDSTPNQIIKGLSYELRLKPKDTMSHFSLTEKFIKKIVNKNSLMKYFSKKDLKNLESIYDQYVDTEFNKTVREKIPQVLLNSSLFALELAENPEYYKFRVYGLLDKYVNMFFNLQKPLRNSSSLYQLMRVQKKPSPTITKSISLLNFEELSEIFSFSFEECDETSELHDFSIQKLNLLFSQVKDLNNAEITEIIFKSKFLTFSARTCPKTFCWIDFNKN